jgi:hypothetical protein
MASAVTSHSITCRVPKRLGTYKIFILFSKQAWLQPQTIKAKKSSNIKKAIATIDYRSSVIYYLHFQEDPNLIPQESMELTVMQDWLAL